MIIERGREKEREREEENREIDRVTHRKIMTQIEMSRQ